MRAVINGRTANGWPPEDCEREARAYEKNAEECEAFAAAAPVKVVLIFEDGTQEVWE